MDDKFVYCEDCYFYGEEGDISIRCDVDSRLCALKNEFCDCPDFQIRLLTPSRSNYWNKIIWAGPIPEPEGEWTAT